jgi:hypothetical protein
MESAVDEAVSTIESAANGMAGAIMAGDVAYATARHAEIADAVKSLPAAVGTAILQKADNMLVACKRRDLNAGFTLNVGISELLEPFCD